MLFAVSKWPGEQARSAKADPDGTDRLIGKTSIAPGGFGSLTRSVAASANFDDFYQIDPDLSIKKYEKS